MKTTTISETANKRVSKTDERLIIDIKAPGYKKEDFKIKCKVLDDKSQVIVVEVKKSSTKEKFGFFKGLDAFKDDTPIDKNIFDVDMFSADYIDGILRVSIPKRSEFITKTLVDFAPADPSAPAPAENEE